MQLHELKPKTGFKEKKRIGRGGKKGTYCGTGGKGQKGRAGAIYQPLIRTWIKKYPKLRGYNFNVSDVASAINLDVLEKNFKAGDLITPEILVEKRIVRRVDGKAPIVKILGNGELKIALNISNCQISKSAKEKVEKAGGSVKMREAKVEKKGKKEVKTKKEAKTKK
jgi:large subunit ribosomal protein L15